MTAHSSWRRSEQSSSEPVIQMGEDTDFRRGEVAPHAWKIIIVAWCVTIIAFVVFFMAVS